MKLSINKILNIIQLSFDHNELLKSSVYVLLAKVSVEQVRQVGWEVQPHGS